MRLPEINNEEIRASLQSALLGEIYPEIRAIAFDYDPDQKILTLKYYLDRPPTEEDHESISLVATYVIADFRFSDFEKIREECIFSKSPINQLGDVTSIVYQRKEP